MKAQWIKLTVKLDAMSLRERAMVFTAVTCAVLFIAYSMVLEPLLAQQKKLLADISQQQNQIGGIDGEITQKIAAFQNDPDAPVRQHLDDVRHQIADADASLRLLSMKTLPVAGLGEQGFKEVADAKDAKSGPAAAPAVPTVVAAALTLAGVTPPPAPGGAAVAAPVPAPVAAPAASVAKPRELLYRHGVEIELQGNYLDMVNYMSALEALPQQLFWGSAKLDAEQYPQAKLTLTLYTMSLDDQWMKL